ncbi:MAG: PilZ domain-containing protein [Bdellovibrionales bacterium]|nr:PilZ domain-containing protein [Bdellovibrionales bacterium]
MKPNTPKQNSSPQRLRAFSRVDLVGDVLIHNETELYMAPLSNLSAGGCFVTKLQNIPEGSKVKIVVRSLRLSAPIQAKGIIVRIETGKKAGVAIEFTSIQQQFRDAIQALVYEDRLQCALKIT